MVSLFCASVALLIAMVIGLGRQVTVFTAFTPGLRLFYRYRRKRLVGIGLVAVFGAATLLTEPGSTELAFLVAAGALSILALVFELERLFPGIGTVRAVPVAEGPETVLDEHAHVLVVERGGERRAYPLESMVMPRHLVHDVLDEVPVVVTYCALCRTGLVFRAEHEGQRLFFEVSGVFRRNLLIEDRETHTLWQQATGEAIYGPLKGSVLEMLPSEQVPWPRARRQSGMTLATDPDGARSAILGTPTGFRLLERATEQIMAPGHTRLSSALPPRETVFGVQINGHSKAYPQSVVRAVGAFRDTIGGVDIDVEFDQEKEVVRIRRRDGEPDPIVEKHWWLGWNEFHPDTEVYRL
jgi:hypothetical protein